MWYNLYKDTPPNDFFELIPYEKCTANKIFHFKQCTIQWYLNDNKITYVSEDVITGVIDTTRKVFGELVVSRGDKNTFIDMDIELFNDKKKRLACKVI